MDYQKHYRSEFPHLIDPVRAVEKQHNPNGWPFYVILNSKGKVVYKENSLVGREEDRIREILDQVALTVKKPARLANYGGTHYTQTTAKKNRTSKRTCEVFPCLTMDMNQDLYLSYVRHGIDGNSVVLRLVGDGTGKEEITVSDGLEDPYYAMMILDYQLRVWIFFTARAETGKYDVFARCITDKNDLPDPVNLTESDDDAMHPDVTRDAAGNLWVTYYRWKKMGFHSRDKEIFARFFDGKTWSKEMQLSPKDLPDYEDHTDPSITGTPGGGVCVAWSWDMHPLEGDKYRRYQRYQSRYHAEAPTIFGCDASAESGMGDLYFFGEASIDNAPELCLVSDKTLWCAWNTLEPGRSKSLYASACAQEAYDRSEQYAIEQGVLDVCSPRFFETSGAVQIVWCSEDFNQKWSLKNSTFKDGRWSKPRVIDEKGNPRFPTTAVARDGRVWVAYSKEEGTGRKITLKRLSF